MADHVWLWPNARSEKPRVISPFGLRFHPIKKKMLPHQGVDFVGFDFNHSITDGKVTFVGEKDGWEGGGNPQVWVKNWDGSLAKYFHGRKDSAVVEKGDIVHAGQRLSTVGMTGTADVVHLHLEISPDGHANSQVNPVPFLRDRVTGGGAAAAFLFVGQEEEDMFEADDRAHLNALYAGMFGARNLTGAADPPVAWINKDGDVQKAKYGLLPIDINTQLLVAQLQGQVSALTALVQQIVSPAQEIDLSALERAAEKGANDAINRVTVPGLIDE
jgi:hypothetical protein